MENNPIRIHWSGEMLLPHPYSMVNREIARELANRKEFEFSFISGENTGGHPVLSDPRYASLREHICSASEKTPDVHVYHHSAPVLKPPANGRWVLFQPWEFGSMYRDWLLHFRHIADEVWVYSQYNRDCYIQDGLAEERVHVVPLGVDTQRFQPKEKPAQPLWTKDNPKGYKFLYVGSIIFRKGVDVLLDAYCNAFSKDDDVSLVIKPADFGASYHNHMLVEKIRAIRNDVNAPHLQFLEGHRDYPMEDLYTECDSLVHPYRSEGFGLCVAEAMACGLSVIVTKGGACDDFTSDETVTYLKEVSKKPINMEKIATREPWVLNPEVDELAEIMKKQAGSTQESIEKGKKASEYIQHHNSWEKTADKICEILNTHRNKTPARHFFPIGSGDVETSEMLKKARELLESQDYERASTLYLELYAEDPENHEVSVGLGLVAWYQERYEEAQRWFAGALRIEPTDEDTLFNFCDVCLKLNQPQTAEYALRKALQIRPSLNETGRYLERLRQETLRGGGVRFEKFVAQREIVKKGETLLREGMLKKASEVFSAILELDPDDFEALNDMGIISFYLGDYEDAMDWFQKSLAIAPTVEDTLINYFDAGLKLKKLDEVIPILKQAVQSRPELANVSSILAEYDRKGQKLYEIDNYDKIDPIEEQFIKGKKLLDSGELNESTLCFLDVIDKKNNHEGAYNGLGIIAYYRGNYEDSYALFRQAAKINPLNADTIVNWYDAAKKLNRQLDVRPYLENIADIEENPAVKSALEEV